MNSMSYISPVLTKQSSSSIEALSTSRQTEDSVERGFYKNDRAGESGIGERKLDSIGQKGPGKTIERPIDQSQHLEPVAEDDQVMADEKSSLLARDESEEHGATLRLGRPSIFKRLVVGIAKVATAVATAILSPGLFMLDSFRDEKRHFSLLLPLRRVTRTLRGSRTEVNAQAVTIPTLDHEQEKSTKDGPRRRASEPESEDRPLLDTRPAIIARRSSRAQSVEQDSPSRHTRSKSVPTTTAETREPTTPRRSIRISVLNEDALIQRRLERQKRASIDSNDKAHVSPNTPLTANSVKSPTSPASSMGLTKYPRAPAPPRPLVPKRQPSYTYTNPPSSNSPRKTLIIDLDETLIHSMSKGGRMSTGHMVEVKLQNPVGVDGMNLGPQVPILYYVHKRPHCDEFLRKVSKWYNLIVFTAAVQEYADPVIDWLELERKYFSARYYRQHCTFRNGAYIKDVGQVEPDLSRVMILDNSPISYTFHEDNAIPIEGWISDPSDNDLLHLVPFLEGLQYTTDVRALLALRLGEASV